jgi:hypothetical protein
MLPLGSNLKNHSPDLGWSNVDRESMKAHGPVDLVMAMALIHLLPISNNVPLIDVANYLADLAENLIIEFVSKRDSQIMRLLKSRLDIFPEYTEHRFEAAFGQLFEIIEKANVLGSERSLYLMKHR